MGSDGVVMNARPAVEPGGKRGLDRVQAQCVQIRRAIDACAAELAKVNAFLSRELAQRRLTTVFAEALARSAAIRGKLEEAGGALATIERALEREVAERDSLDRKIEAVIEQEEAARRAAFHDVLTGLANRTLFNNRLEHGLEQAKRRSWTLAVMCLDIDRLRDVNDLYGREVGDAVLQTIARRLKVSVRGEDTVGRGSEDEFLYLLMDFRDAENIAMIAERFLRGIEAPCEIEAGGRSVRPSVHASIGIAVYPKDGATGDALMKSAAAALAKTKRLKSRLSFAS